MKISKKDLKIRKNNISSLPLEVKKRIIKEAIRGANEEQRNLVRRYNELKKSQG
ncbi:MAG: hypothetical protein V1860_03045 [bacterium]